MKPKNSTTLNVNPETKILLKVEAARRGMTMEKLAEEIFSEYLAAERDLGNRDENCEMPTKANGESLEVVVNSLNRGARDATNAESQEDFEPWVSYLLHILERKNAFAVPSIQKNLEAFVRLTDLDGGAHAPTPGEPSPDIDSPRTNKQILAEGEDARRDAKTPTQKHPRKRRGSRKAS